jgi:hypothetical protein
MQSKYVVGRPAKAMRLGGPLVGEDQSSIDNPLPGFRRVAGGRIAAQ